MKKLNLAELVEHSAIKSWHREPLRPNILTINDTETYDTESHLHHILLDILALQEHPSIKYMLNQNWAWCIDSSKTYTILTCDDTNENEIYKQKKPISAYPSIEENVYLEEIIITLPNN